MAVSRKKGKYATHEKFWAAVDRSAGADGCWPWGGFKDRRGYGRLSRHGRMLNAHRLAWSLANGDADIPAGLVVMHMCDNPQCCNPAHLRLGTYSENTRDMHAKGRSKGPRGETHPFAKLTAERIEFARRLRSRGLNLDNVAYVLSVCQSTVSSALRGVTFAERGR